EDLCNDLRVSAFSGKPIALDLSIESHDLDHQRAVAIGLIINELITNALKYAFPKERSGKISVSFEKHGGEFRFRVSDDGVGRATHEPKKGAGHGLDIVRTLAAQLGGRLEQKKTDVGATFEVVFPENRSE